jgi:hypothetical protein
MFMPPAAAANTYLVTNTHDSGAGSLRQAITAANASSGKDNINFQINSGKQTIKPLTPLPEITDPVILDATTQPGFLGKPLVELDGSAGGAHPAGLRISAGGSTVRGFVINRFGGAAIVLTGEGLNVVQGNYIGTDATGLAAAGNSHGVFIEGGSAQNLVGGSGESARNVISGNKGDGVHVAQTGGVGNIVRGNYVGLSRDGAAALPNASAGVRLLATGNSVGGGTDAEANVISGNARGVVIDGSAATGNWIRGNIIGLDPLEKKALGNTVAGVEISGPNNTVGGSVETDGNVISGNGDGVVLTGANSKLNTVQNNRIGIGAGVLNTVGNTGAGVRIVGASNNLVGGTFDQTGNLFAFNKGAGVRVEGANAIGNKIQGNRLGGVPDPAGGGAFGAGNFGAGVEIVSASTNLVGGTGNGQYNYITGNATYGVDISAGSTGNLVQGNQFGMFECNCNIFGNALGGVRIAGSSNNTIGGTQPGARNFITEGEGEGAIVIEDGSAGNTVAGNYVGLNPDGNVLKQVYAHGVVIRRASGNLLGGTTPAARNVIGGFAKGGVLVEGPDAFGNKIQGNYIGTDKDGHPGTPNAPAGTTNTGGGVRILGAFDTLVGGTEPGAANLIAGNGAAGVIVETGLGNSVLGNSIHSNGQEPIDLYPIFVNQNDALDADLGVNGHQNHPLITSAKIASLTLQVSAVLDSAPERDYRVEFFVNKRCGTEGANDGDGQTYVGSAQAATDAAGHAALSFAVLNPLAGGFVTATATDPDGNTSEFAPCVPVGPSSPGQFQFQRFGFVSKETDGAATVVVTRLGGNFGPATVDYTTEDIPNQSASKAGQDYTKTSGKLAFADGEVYKTFTVPLDADGPGEGDEGFIIKLSNPSKGAALGPIAEGFVTVYDHNPSNPALTFSEAVVTEGDSGTKQAVVHVEVEPHANTVVISYQTADGTAKAGEDYDAIALGSQALTFAPGENQKDILINVHGDAVLEEDEVFILKIYQIIGGHAFADFGNNHRHVFILNDEAVPTSFAFEAASLSTVENAGSATFNVKRTGPSAGAVSVNYATADGTAKAISDYVAASGTLHFADGETTKSVTVQLTDDTTYEGLEAFELKLNDPSAGATLGAPSAATINVANDDSAPSLSVADTSVVEGNANTTDAVFNVSLSAASGVAVNVSYETFDIALAQHPALAGEDYLAAQGALLFAPGETSKQVVVKVKGDTDIEPDEVFALRLNGSDSATLADKTGECQIKNDDAPASKPSVSVADAVVAEGHAGTTDALFAVTLSAPSAQQVSVPYATADLQALNAAQAGTDYVAASGTVTFAPGETSKQIAVQVKGDGDFEAGEAFVLNLGAVAGDAATLDDAIGQGFILNDDDEPEPTPDTFQFEKAVYAAFEDSTKINVTVTRAGDASGAASVDYETQSGTATERGEFTTALGTLHFAPGETAKTFDILLTEDSADEDGTEQADLLLSNPVGGQLGALSTAQLLIQDDSVEPQENANDATELFVRQHYHDFLNREADNAGLKFWTQTIENCGASPVCRDAAREQVSAAFFLSIEFQETGFLVHRLTEASFDRVPRYRDFLRDARRLGEGIVVGQQGWEQRLTANKQALLEEWVNRAEFKTAYDALTDEQYVEALAAHAGLALDAGAKQALAGGLKDGALTRAAVLGQLAEHPAFKAHEMNRAFVLMQYFGYLRRNPDDLPDTGMEGFDFWLSKLEQFGGDYHQAQMIRAFLLSIEYRSRFGQP